MAGNARRGKASTSTATASLAHLYTPLGEPTSNGRSPHEYWQSFKRKRIDADDEAKGQRPANKLAQPENEVTTEAQSETSEEEVYSIGSVVLVRNTMSKPVIGLITQIWTVPDAGIDVEEDGDVTATGFDAEEHEEDANDDDADPVPLWCKVRFYYWPDGLSELTQTRMKGLVAPNEVYYGHQLDRRTFGRKSKRSLAAAENAPSDDFARGPSLLESDGFSASEILGRAFVYSTADEARKAKNSQSQATTLLHKGKIVPRHLFCAKAIDPQKELFWTIDYQGIRARGENGEGWNVLVKSEEKDGRNLRDWADAERKRVNKAVKAEQVEIDEQDKKSGAAAVSRKPRVARSAPKPKAAVSRRKIRATSASDSSEDEDDSDSDSDFEDEDEEPDFDYLKSARRARRRQRQESSTPATSDDEDEGTSTKRKGGLAPSTPSKNAARYSAIYANPTPHSKRIIDLRRSARERLMDQSHAASSGAFLPDPTAPLPLQKAETIESLQSLSPYQRAKRLLHVSTTPSRLPCRSTQAEDLMCLLEDSLDTGIGSCIYISGVPGTGKTATVRGVIAELQRRATEGSVNPFDFLEINGMKVADAGEAYSMLWSTVGDRGSTRRSPKAALNLLSRHYAGTSKGGLASAPGRAATIVLMDELDQLMTSRQDVMYNLFNWPAARNSRLIVVAVANTMDLPERTMSAKVASRLGMTRITFMPYTDRELGEIVRSRLGLDEEGNRVEQGDQEGQTFPADGIDEDEGSALLRKQQCQLFNAATLGCETIFANGAIRFASKRISNVSGDARRMLDVCRRAIETIEVQGSADSAAAPVDKRAVTIADIRNVLDGMAKSSRPSHISRSLSTHAKVLLVSMLSLVRKTGIAETCLADLAAHHRALSRLHGLGDSDDAQSKEVISGTALLHPLGQLVSMGLLIPVGSGVGPGKAAGNARILLSNVVREDEVRLALEGDEDRRIRGML
ncbi:unnamed protein product [Jaminaea pallidilutea]